ncbi:BaeS Signal transduction histidine kinase [Microbacteriaceae bacterium]
MQSKIGKAWELVSLRSKLTGLSVALIGLLLLVSSFGTVTLLRAYLQQNTDNLITSAATLLSQENPSLIEPKILAKRLNLPRLPSDYLIAVLDLEGNTIFRIMASDSDEDDLPNLTILNLAGTAATAGLPFDLDQHGGLGEVTIDEHDSWRVVAKPFRNYAATVVVALPNSANLELLRQYRAIGGGFGFLLLAISGLSIWLTIAQALRPLREVERTAKLVASGDLSQRLIERPGKTEIARLNRSLNSMLDSLEDSVSSRNKTVSQMRRFVADASHELRTPLVSVRGYAELYRKGALTKKSEVQEAMGRIEAEAIRMSSLVESLLTLARLDENQKLDAAPTDLAKLARDIIARDIQGKQKISLSLLTLGGAKVPADFSLSAEVNEGQIRQVLVNLIENAKRFSPDNGSIEIAIGQKTDDEVILDVIDHGEGIPKQLRDKVFERFYRADNSRNRDTGGTGLGLAIVKEIVSLHKGRIEVRETPGGGATFRIKLPAQHNWV